MLGPETGIRRILILPVRTKSYTSKLFHIHIVRGIVHWLDVDNSLIVSAVLRSVPSQKLPLLLAHSRVGGGLPLPIMILVPVLVTSSICDRVESAHTGRAARGCSLP